MYKVIIFLIVICEIIIYGVTALFNISIKSINTFKRIKIYKIFYGTFDIIFFNVLKEKLSLSQQITK